ncbi:hypothetical protein SLEP1_g53022 [Rubroshorea leprosula]|uniref:Uncharacterized protein n=1 Tax=Rubroshorea leprosula TaxID=152421 RepID=A0AAV5MAE6_9ROSI|nr:hypothetical protein SLEP1_g53022 [Rubroshorea leprosula]
MKTCFVASVERLSKNDADNIFWKRSAKVRAGALQHLLHHSPLFLFIFTRKDAPR